MHVKSDTKKVKMMSIKTNNGILQYYLTISLLLQFFFKVYHLIFV